MEVIVVDNNSKDKTSFIAKKFQGILNIRVINEKKKGRGAARFTGFKAAKGDIIFSTDADAILPPQWTEKYLQKFEKSPQIVAITGIPAISDSDPMRNMAFNLWTPQFLKLNYFAFGHPGLSGFSFAIRRDAYKAAGGFDPVTDCYEDLDLAHRVHKVGKILLMTDLPITFSARRFENGLIRGWGEYAKNFVDMFILKKKRVELSNPRKKKP